MRRRIQPWALILVVAAALVGADAIASLSVSEDDAAATGNDRITFNFKDASFEQVIDFFSRSTGLPVVWETDPPQGSLSYRSPESYDRAEALRVLNIILQSRGVMLRVSDDMLYLQRLDRMQRSNIPTFVGELPGEVTSDQIVTVVRPLDIALAKPLAERLAQMVAEYGSITAMEQQNSLVLTETAAQVRRLLKIVEELDRADPDSQIEIFAIRHAKAMELMEPLKALMSQRVERFVIDQRGQQQKIEEDEMSGLSLSADERTNSIIARGTHVRIQGVRDAISLLDVPAATGARSIRSISLAMLSPRDAAGRLNEVYRKLPENERPTVIAMDDFARVTIVGNAGAIDEGVALLREIDGGELENDNNDHSHMTVIALEHAPPASIINALRGLLNNRQLAVMKMVTGADGQSLILSGPRREVSNIQSIIPALDRPGRVDREVRMLTLDVPQPASVVDRTRELYARQTEGDESARELVIEFNADDRVLTLVGASNAINRFSATLRAVEGALVIDRETRQVRLSHARPSQIVQPLRTLGRQLLEVREEPYVEPAFAAIDALDQLLITAVPDQFGVLVNLVEALDRPDPADYQFRVISLAGVSNPGALINRAETAFGMLTIGRADDDRVARPTVQHDEVTGNLIVSGRTEAVGLFERAVNEARNLLPPAREGRMIALRQANASDIIEPLRDLLDRTSPINSARTIPAPVLDVIDRTNSLYIVAEPAQHQMIERYVRELDRIEPTDLPPLRLIQVRAADAANLSRLLRERYDARPQEQRREQPVEVNADAATNTLIVTAHEDVFGEIREFVDSVNRAGEAEAERETMIFPLKLARATDVAIALEKLYPEPPMPRDRLNRPMPHLQQPREVHVAADAGTNTLIIEAPTERRASFEALVERLDRVELPPSAELRTYHISRGDPREIANTLRDLASQGVMSERGDDGQRVQVTVQVEPTSRTLILAGDERTFRMAEEVLRDLEAVPVERSLRVFEITGADPQRVAEQAQRLYREQTAEIPGASPVNVEVDRDGSSLLVIAEDEAMFRFASILNQLQETIGPPPDVRLVPLDYADAADVVQFLESLSSGELGLVSGRSGSRPMFEAIERTNSVLIAARAEQHQIIRSLIDSLDVLEDEQMPPLRILQLRTADAANLANALMRQYNQRPSEERATKRVQISADANTNALIVAAHPDMLPEVQAIVDELNRADRRDYDGREIRIFPLRVARAEELARTIDEMFPEPPIPVDNRNRPRPDLQEPREVVVRADRQTNSLIVDAPAVRMPNFEQLVEQLDRQQFVEQTEVRTYPVLYAELDAVAQTLRELSASGTLSPASNDRTGGRASVTIATESVSRTLIVAGPVDIFDRVEQVLAELDAQRAGLATTLRFVSLQHARAEQVVPLVRELIVGEGANERAAGQVRIAADSRLNAVIISAPAAILNMAEELVSQFDVDPAGAAGVSPRAVRVLAVRNAEASELAENLRAIFEEGDQVDVPPTIRVDAASNSLLVRATELQLRTIEQVVERVDQATVASSRQMQMIRVDPSKASAEEVARTLQRMLDRSEPSRVRVITVDELRREREQQHEEALPVGGSSMLPTEDSSSMHGVAGVAPSAIHAIHLLAIGMVDDPDADAEAELAAPAPDITIAVDPVSNSLIILGSPRAVEHTIQLAQQVQDQIPAAPGTIRYVSLADGGDASHMARLLNQSLSQMTPAGGERGEFAQRVSIIADQPGNALIVSCNDADFQTVGDLIAALSQPSAIEFDIRTILLERASASAVASAIQRLYDDRARITAAMRGRRDPGRRISIIGDEASRTVLVAASDDDFQQIVELARQFDSPQATSALEFRVFELRHARATEIRDVVEGLVQDLLWSQGPVFWAPQGMRGMRQQGTIAVRSDARLNALIVTGEGDRFAMVESLIDVLDAPPSQGRERLVRMYRVQHARTNLVAEIIREAFGDQGRSARRWWEPPDPTVVQVRVDDQTNTLIVSASQNEHDEISNLIRSLDEQVAPVDQQMRVLALEYAQAGDMARTLRSFLVDRARSLNEPAPTAVILPNQATNSLVVSAGEEDMLTIRSLLTELDQDDLSGERVIEIIVLQEGEAADIARILSQQFGVRGRGGPQSINITPDLRTNSIIVNASRQQFAQVQSLVERLDTPRASDETIIRTYALDAARAQEVQRLLADTLRLDARGRTEGITIRLEDSDDQAVEVKARIVADRRSNSLIVTATEQSFPVIESLIRRLDDVPTATQIEYRIIPLQHALVNDVSFTLQQMARGFPREEPQPRIDYNRRENQLIIAATSEQFEQIGRILQEIDQPSQRERVTDFVPLQFAGAQQVQEALSVFYGAFAMEADTPSKRNVRIVADPATNSLVISAERDEWEGIRNLLAELDNEEYDSSLQLRVLPLMHADAQSVAQAINQAFAGTLERSRAAPPQRPRRGEDDRRDPELPTVLVESEEWVRASAEPLTNSVIISASRQNIRKIEAIIDTLDVADYAKLPAPQLIPVTTGDPRQLAEAIREAFTSSVARPGRRSDARQRLVIVGDVTSNTIIVRADEDEYAQIKALADALQQQASEQGVSVHVLQLTAAPAARVAGAIRDAYQARARLANQPLSIQVDPQGNTLVIASTASLFREIEQTVQQLDALSPSAGQAIFIIELENISPDAARSVIESIGLHQRQPDDSVARLVSEPIRVTTLAGRNALIVLANPADRETVVGLLKAVDSEPQLAEAKVHLVKLRNAAASSVASILREVLNPAQQQTQTALARSVQEQIRRLTVRHDGLDGDDLSLDLTKPVRLIVDSNLNALVISSTDANVRTLRQIIAMFDQLPITDAATVRVFPLQNIAAEQFARICRDLFTQGKRLNTVPGTSLTGVPGGMVGKALLDEIAITVDERTNTVIVAGKDDSVAFVEVLTQRLDSDVAAGWIEPRIVQLRFADAGELADTLQSVLVQGAANLPQASPLQRQIGRLRVARNEDDGGRVLESDVFQPMTRLVIRPEPQLNALVLVGTPINLEVVTELVKMLDVEAASPSAAVRIYPIEYASAARLSRTITQLFDQQVQTRAIRPEDRVIVQADERTNALIVTTSARSFAVLESLLESLDSEIAPDLREIRRVELEHASATRLAGLVQQMMDARLERMRRVQPETADLERATIIAEPRTNSLIIAAGNESFDVIRRLVADLDSSTLSDTALVHVIPVTHGNVDRIADAVNQIMQRRYADQPAEVRASQTPLVMTDPRTSSLLIAASQEDVNAIENLVERLGQAPSSPAVGLHVVNVAGSSRVDQLAQRLSRLMQDRLQTLGDARTPSDRVSIEPDLVSNSLIIAATEENMQVIRDLIDVLVKAGTDSAGGREMDVIMLTTSRASDMVNLLNDLHVRETNRVRGENTVRVTADDRLNAVLVNASNADLQVIRNLVGRLDGAKPARVVETKFIPLQSANALETVNLIQNVLSGRGIGSGRGGAEQSTVLKYIREFAEEQFGVEPPQEFAAEMLVGAAIRESITLTPDVRTNTVIVSAPRESMRMIEQMIRDLDSSSIGSQNIRIFKLVNADALSMARILTDLFSLQRQGNLFVLRPREAPSVVDDGLTAPPPSVGGIELTAVPDERQQLAITVDSRTNSLLVSGTPTYLDLVERVVKDLDSQEANERETIVYPLRNATAVEVARVVTDFVDREQQKLISTLGADQIGSAARLLDREITIVGDEKSNTVLVSASPRYRERLMEMIHQLDIDPPQVLIQVLLAEVTLDSADDWGVDMEFRAQIDGTNVVGGYGLASAFVSGIGVPSLAIASSDFDLLIRAMQSQGRLQVLSNPSVMAANNEQARIQVGETIRLPTDVSVTDAGRTLTSVEAEEIGVILQVTPSINPDGFVRMVITPEISSLSARTTRISEDFEAPIIIKRTADTTVTVFDGQTIVLGGLISDRFERRDRKVPFLGDLPLLGGLFRSMREETTKTELLIVLTPHVIQSPAEVQRVDELTNREIDRLSLPDEVKNSIRDNTSNGGAEWRDLNKREWISDPD